MCLYSFVYVCFILNSFVKKKNQISIQICKLGNALNANDVCSRIQSRKCLLAMLLLVILMLILVLLNLNTCYADTDADLCIRIMSLCCNH